MRDGVVVRPRSASAKPPEPSHVAYLADWLATFATESPSPLAACGHAERAVDFLNATTGRVQTIPAF
jgi:hypothetical protein